MKKINARVLVSGADYFTSKDAINALMDSSIPVDLNKAKQEHTRIINAFRSVAIEVTKVNPPQNCQDGVYTANWALVIGTRAVMSKLPIQRKPEQNYAKKILEGLNLETITVPEDIKAFSGQGDSLVVDDYIFCQSPYRTDPKAHKFLKSIFPDMKIISLTTKPSRWFKYGPRKRNKLTGWIDSPSYDIDLALAILKPKDGFKNCLIAYCPSLFTRKSRKQLRSLDGVDKILVSKKEALNNYALNLVSTGTDVVMNKGTINFKNDLQKQSLNVIELDLTELKKGGGSIRCTSLTY